MCSYISIRSAGSTCIKTQRLALPKRINTTRDKRFLFETGLKEGKMTKFITLIYPYTCHKKDHT